MVYAVLPDFGDKVSFHMEVVARTAHLYGLYVTTAKQTLSQLVITYSASDKYATLCPVLNWGTITGERNAVVMAAQPWSGSKNWVNIVAAALEGSAGLSPPYGLQTF